MLDFSERPLSVWGAVLTLGLRLLNWIHVRVFLPYLSYANRVAGFLPSRKMTSFIVPDGPVNPILLMAALDERSRDSESNPDGAQAKLNAIYHAVQDCEALKSGSLRMLAALITSGCPQDLAFVQVMANNIELGMYVERRLQSANAGESQANTTPEKSANEKGKP